MSFSQLTCSRQEVLRQQSEHEPEGRHRQLPRVHPVPQDTGERPHEGDTSAWTGAVQHHHERARLPGAVGHPHASKISFMFFPVFVSKSYSY